MKLLFEEAAQRCYKPSEDRIKRFKDWIEKANQARRTGNLEANSNQYDKAEELITFYTFAPLVLSLNRLGLINRILGLAGISPYEENIVGVGLEMQYSPPAGYLKWIKERAKDHPIRYIRQRAAKRAPNKPLESKTHIDAVIETDKLLILFEVKFTSDIADSTTFNPCRNQLARLIDVGLEATKHSGKEVLVILATPSKLCENRCRLYYYKVNEYSDPAMIQRDIGWRPVSVIKDFLLAVEWIALEDLISLLYRDFVHPDKEEALKFFSERNLT